MTAVAAYLVDGELVSGLDQRGKGLTGTLLIGSVRFHGTNAAPPFHVPSGRSRSSSDTTSRHPDRVLRAGRLARGRPTEQHRDVDEVRPRGGRLPRRERRAQLLSSALEVFVAQGYHAAAMDDIAERAGVSKPVLYQHFPGKLELYLALLETSCDAIIANCGAALESTHDNKQRVAAAIDAFYEYVAGDTGAFRLVFESDLTNEPAVRGQIERVTNECANLIAAVIHDDTGLPGPASRLLAVSLVGMAQVSARFWLSEAGGIDAGGGGGAGLGTRLARDPRLPAHRRPLNRERTTQKESRPWRSRSACSTPPESSSSRPTRTRRRSRSRSPRRWPASGVLTLTDSKGRQTLVPADKIAYVEIGGGVAGHVGFRS